MVIYFSCQLPSASDAAMRGRLFHSAALNSNYDKSSTRLTHTKGTENNVVNFDISKNQLKFAHSGKMHLNRKFCQILNSHIAWVLKGFLCKPHPTPLKYPFETSLSLTFRSYFI